MVRPGSEIRRLLPDPYGEAWAIHDLGIIHTDLRQFTAAIDCFEQALAIRRAIGDRHGEAQTRYLLGKTLRDTGNPTQATNHLRRALTILDDLHDPRARDLRAHLDNEHQFPGPAYHV